MVGSADGVFNGFPTLPILFGAKPEKWRISLAPHSQATCDNNATSYTIAINIMDLTLTLREFCMNPRHTRWVAPLLILGDAVLCALIIWKVPCEFSIMF
jgi:hypothetical protein